MGRAAPDNAYIPDGPCPVPSRETLRRPQCHCSTRRPVPPADDQHHRRPDARHPGRVRGRLRCRPALPGRVVPLLATPRARTLSGPARRLRRGRQGSRALGRRQGVHGRARRQALAYLPRRLRRGRGRHRVAHRRVRQPRPGLPAVHQLRPRPGGKGHRRRVLKRAMGGSSPTRCRPGPLPARARVRDGVTYGEETPAMAEVVQARLGLRSSPAAVAASR